MSLLRRFVASSWHAATSTLARHVTPIHQQQASWWNGTQNILARTFSNTRHKRHKRLLKHAKGFRGRSKNCYSIAIRRVEKSWQYAYRDRKRKRREYKKVWIQRISAGVRQYAFRYSEFMGLLYKHPNCNIALNRKVLSELAATEPFAFKAIVDVVQQATGTYKDHAVYSPTEGWDFDDDDDEDEYYYDVETGDWLLKPSKKTTAMNEAGGVGGD